MRLRFVARKKNETNNELEKSEEDNEEEESKTNHDSNVSVMMFAVGGVHLCRSRRDCARSIHPSSSQQKSQSKMPPTIHFGKIETLLPRALTSTLIASSSSAGNPTRSTRSGGRCLLFTSHRGTTRASTENKVRQVIGSEVRGIELFDFSPAFVAGEPSIESGVEAMRIINRLKPATVVAAGGASVMSLAKYACNRTNTPGNLRDLILIPTVSCAGEEVIDGFHAIDWRGNEVCLYDDASSDFRANRIVLVDESIGEMDEIDSRTDFLATMHSMSYILDPTAARKQKKNGGRGGR